MKASKPKLQVLNGKTPKVKLGASASNNQTASPLAPKKDYKKQTSAQDFGAPGFGQTGMTGES